MAACGPADFRSRARGRRRDLGSEPRVEAGEVALGGLEELVSVEVDPGRSGRVAGSKL